jgi:hypothetical protein
MFLPMWYLKFIAFIVFFVLLYFFPRDYKKKTIAGYAIGSIMLYCTGIIIYYAGMIPLLKFYWFRFADTVLPFLFYITVAVMLSDFIRSEIVKRTKIIRVAVFVMGITASLAGVIYTGSDFTANLRKIISSGKPLFLSSLDIDIQKTQQWIKNNTPSGAIFLVNPSWTYFYYLAERPMIVSFKHSPQSDKKIIEWFDRMTMIIGKDHDPKKLARFPFKRTAMKGYSELTEERVRAIHEKFPFKFYIAENKNRMPYQKVFAQGKYTVYKIQ